MTNIQKRLLCVMKEWDSMRLRNELEMYILSKSDKELEDLFFDDIATEGTCIGKTYQIKTLFYNNI